MENLLKDLLALIKLPNDSKIQLKAIAILNEILEQMKKMEKKKLTDSQIQIEDTMHNYIINSRANSDICSRYIYFIYKYLFDFGLSSRLNEFISKFSQMLTSSKSSLNVKLTSLWLLGKVCVKSNYKSPQLVDLIHLLIKTIKNTSDLSIKNESFASLYRLLHLKLPNFYNQINDIIKILIKQEKYFQNETKCKKNILKSLDSAIFYLNHNSITTHYESIVNFLNKAFEDEDSSIRKIAIDIYVNLHVDKLFEQTIDLKMIMRKRNGEPLKNFLEVLLYLGNIYNTSKNDVNYNPTLNIKISYIQILKQLFEKNIEFINSSESLIIKVYDLIISYFQLNYVGFVTNNIINYKQNLNNLNNLNGQTSITQVTHQHNNQNKLNNEIEELYKLYLKIIYNSNYRKSLLKHIFKRLNESQSYIDKMENLQINVNVNISNEINEIKSPDKKNKKDDKEKQKEKEKPKEKYTEFHVTSMLISLIEFSENNYDIFEITYKSFSDISQNLVVYLISNIKSFRILINRVFINLAYFIPAWRIPILTLILNLSSVAHAEVAALKNTFIYLVDENSSEYKYSLIIRNNLDLLKDISNCLGIVLSTFAHKSTGVTVDMSNAALTIAKNMIIGKFADEEDNPKSLSIKEKTTKFNYSNSDVDAHKEAGWIIIQGLAAMDYTWLTHNYKSLFQLWKYVFSEHCCSIEESELQNSEYREALISEFFIKKAALASLRKFIVASSDFVNSQTFQNLIPKFLSNALLFFIPYENKKILLFYKNILKEQYKEAKSLLYDCFYSIPVKLISQKFNQILYPICDEITAIDYSEFSTEYIYTNLNFFDTFMCEKNLSQFNKISQNRNNNFLINNFNIEKYNLFLTERLNSDINAKIVNSSLNLLVDIMLESSLNVKNRQLIFKHFLTHMSEISMKTVNDKMRLNKAINIVYALFLILKKSHMRNILIINDESIFASSKMIFDIGFKIDNNLIRRISAEGHGYLIKVSSNPQYNINYYLTALECKFKNEHNIDNQQFINTFYMIANIFRTNQFSDLIPVLDLYMNFIISYFNRIEDLFNPFISQSVYIITEVLIKNDQIDHARKMIEVYKLYLFINSDNSIFFKEKEMMARNSLSEIRLMMILILLGDNIKSNEIELLKLLLNKYMLDEKYKSNKIKRNFLYFAKMILKENPKLKELVHNSNFMQFLIGNVIDNKMESSVDIFNNKIDVKFSLEILIVYILTMDTKNIDIFKEFCEKLVNSLNNFYNDNKFFYFNNFIISKVINIPNGDKIIFDKNSDTNLNQITKLIDLDNKNFEKPNSLMLDFIYINSHLTKLAKIILKIYFEKKFGNFAQIINLIKELILNQLVLYSTSTTIKSSVAVKSDSLTRSEETKEDVNNVKPLLTIRKLNKSMHINLKKFLIKSLKHCLNLALNNLNNIQISNKNSNVFIEFLNYFMNSSMLITSCEECWEIKSKGVDLLLKIIQRFSKIKDARTDDDSLLIQQYEAQISSCIKTIFNNSYSIDALFKGMNLLYSFISVPISTDSNYIKKIQNFVDFNLKETSGIGTLGTFSEKYDHTLICKKLNFFCKMYLTTNFAINNKNKKSKNELFFNLIDVVNSKISRWEIYYEFIDSNEHINNLTQFFFNNFEIFFINIFNMLNDFFIVLTQDKKVVKNYRNFEFLKTGNRISHSLHKILKYGQLYVKILAILVNDNKFVTNENKEKIKKMLNYDKIEEICKVNPENKNENIICINPQENLNDNPLMVNNHSDFSFDNIFQLIFYYLNYFTFTKLQSENDYKLPEYVVYSESDINNEIKEKILLNSLLVNDLVEVILNLLNNSTEIVKINKSTFFELLKTIINLFSLSIEELDIKLLGIIELLLTKWLPKFTNEYKEKFSLDELSFLSKNISCFIFLYFKEKLNDYNSNIALKLIEILNSNLSNILNLYPNINEEKIKNSNQEFFYHSFKIILTIFEKTTNPQVLKLCAAKIFPIFIKIENLELLQLVLPIFKENVIQSKQFDRFFLIYFMILQYLSKRNNTDEIIKEYFIQFITEDLLQSVNGENKEYFLFIFKSIMLATSQIYDDNLKLIIENLIFYLIENKLIIKFFNQSEDLQNIILTYILSQEDIEKRRILVNLITLMINDNLAIINMDMLRICVFIFKLMSKDMEILKDLVASLEMNLVMNLDNLIKMQQAQQAKINEEKKNNPKINIDMNQQNVSINREKIIQEQISSGKTQNTVISSGDSQGGPKLKAIKFKK